LSTNEKTNKHILIIYYYYFIYFDFIKTKLLACFMNSSHSVITDRYSLFLQHDIYRPKTTTIIVKFVNRL